jgi:hypothetical protein
MKVLTQIELIIDKNENLHKKNSKLTQFLAQKKTLFFI